MKTVLDQLQAMSPVRLVVYLIAVGAAAGGASWIVVFGLHLVFGVDRPTWTALFWAVPRGSFFALLLGGLLRGIAGRR